MIFKKALLTLSLVPFLASCNANASIAGTYGFQMGKEAGTHFGVFLELTDKSYTATDITEEGLKQFNLSLNVKNGKESEDSSFVQDLLNWLSDDEEGATVKGYYKLTDEKNKEGENLLKIGFSFNYIYERIKAEFEENTGEPLDFDVNSVPDIGRNKAIQRLVYATYKQNTVNIFLPVSIEDVVFQLYWYGVDFQAYYETPGDESTLTFKLEDVTEHDFGTLPTEEEIAAINQTYKEKHKAFEMLEINNEYRIFHQLKMGLSKR